MAWIKEINRKDNELLNVIYKRAETRTDSSPANVLRVHSLHPEALECHMALYETIMFGNGHLSRAEREMIGVVVSRSNECPYCVYHHDTVLALVSDNHQHKLVAKDYRDANLNSREFEICKYCEKLTKTPYKMIEADIIALRENGCDDRTIFEINQIASYFNYVNRIVFGLGVELE